MNVELPGPLRAALDRALEGVGRKDLAARAGRTSAAYRAGGGSAGVIRDEADALAYALTRLPATYAACARVFAEAARMAPAFAPRTLLDAGVGTGAASWAAREVWDIEAATWLDESAPFLALARKLAEGAPLANADARRVDLVSGGSWPHADLVCASYALAEIAPAKQGDVVRSLWAACDGMMVLVEPGTPAGHARILAARDVLIGEGAPVLAPCPHTDACPLTGSDWCHFSVRLPRSRDHRLAKGAEVPFEDEKFSYLVVARERVVAVPRGARVLAPPRVGKPGIELKLCAPAGALETHFVAKRDKAAYAVARRLDWGDAL